MALPIAVWSLRRLARAPSLPLLLGAYALTLLALLFFGRYFHSNYLGYVLAVASPIPFVAALRLPRLAPRTRRPLAEGRPARATTAE